MGYYWLVFTKLTDGFNIHEILIYHLIICYIAIENDHGHCYVNLPGVPKRERISTDSDQLCLKQHLIFSDTSAAEEQTCPVPHMLKTKLNVFSH